MFKTNYWRLIKYLTVAGLLASFCKYFLNNRAKSKLSLTLRPIPQEQYNVISPKSYNYLLNEPDICKDRTPWLVLTVPVAPEDSYTRHVIRKTWGQQGLIPNVDTVCLFYLGLPTKDQQSHVQEELELESRQHNDIIQMNFLDSYSNLTIKTMMIMNWLATHCQSASYAMKVDSDIFLNVHYLANNILDVWTNAVMQDYITGSIINDGRPRRDKRSKWYLSTDIYPEATFPPYVSGAGYVFSINLAEKISWASKFVRPIPLEDVYVGLCLKVLGVYPVYSHRLFFLHNPFQVRHLVYQRCTFSKLVIVNGFNPQQLLNIWHDFQKAQFTC